jgi:hypothetical protein
VRELRLGAQQNAAFNRLHHAVLCCTYVIRIQNGVDRECSLIARLIEGWDELSCRLISRSVCESEGLVGNCVSPEPLLRPRLFV